MTPYDAIKALRAANPVPGTVAATLPVRAGESELLRQIAAYSPERGNAAQTGRFRARRRFAVGFAAAAAIAVVAIAPFGGSGGGPAPAFAAALVRFANSTPRLLLQIPGWHVVFVEQDPGGYGEMHFIRGRVNAQGMPATSLTGEASLVDRFAQLTWISVSSSERRYIQSGHQRIPTGLGVPATRLQVEGRTRDYLDVAASLIYDNRAISLRVTVTGMSDLRTVLQALNRVSTTAWLEAMPASVIKSANSGVAIRQMLKDIPLPPGFDAAKIPGIHDTQTNYYLGTELTGTVACMWIADWSRARATHDTAAEQHAIAAMATAPRWPLFRWMSKQGAWPQAIIQYAQDMPKGAWFGHSLTAAVDPGLGCSQLGVKLPGADRPNGGLKRVR
jgi:hypothetical protein